MHQRAIPLSLSSAQSSSSSLRHVFSLIKNYSALTFTSSQGTLDGVAQPRAVPFTNAGLLDHLVQLIVAEDKVCT